MSNLLFNLHTELFILTTASFSTKICLIPLIIEIYFTNHKIDHCKVYSSVVFSIFAKLCKHRHSNSRTVSSSPKKPLYLFVFILQPPGNNSCTFCLYGFAHSGIFYEWNHIICGLLYLTPFT